MSTFVNTRDIIGETALFDSILDGSAHKTCTDYRDDRITKLVQRAFRNWTALTKVDLPNLTGSIDYRAFDSCSALIVVILRNGTMARLISTNAFEKTPIASGTGYIYVPRALVDSYKAATNWSTYAAQFRALEDYTVDGTTAGNLDETKI